MSINSSLSVSPSSTLVSSAAQLITALSSARSGQTILLAAGNYGSLTINQKNFSGAGITIAAANPSAPPVITGLQLTNSSGIKFSGLDFNSAANSASHAFTINKSSNITFSGIYAHGSINSSGFLIENSNNVLVSGSTFTNLANAIGEQNNTNISIIGNLFTGIRSDGIDNAGSSNVTISGNSFTNFQPGSSTEHPDAIQFWTTNTTHSASDIVITNNNISVGSGAQVQGIFMTDQVGTLPYENVTISGNTVTGEMWNGIVINHADNVTMTNNAVIGLLDSGLTLQNFSSFGVAPSSWLEVANATGVNLSGNNASSYVISGDSNVVLGQNSINGALQQKTEYSAITATLSNIQSTLVLTGNLSVSGIAGAAGQTIMANNAGDRLYDSAAGGDTLIGGAKADVLIARSGSDTLTGGGGNNTFQVNHANGDVTITDFAAAGTHNKLDISSFISSGMHPELSQVGSNTIISFTGTSETITLLGVQENQLTATSTGFVH